MTSTYNFCFANILNNACRMNPLGLPADRFIIAEDAEGQVMGFGQLQQQPNAERVQFLELRTLIVTDAAR